MRAHLGDVPSRNTVRPPRFPGGLDRVGVGMAAELHASSVGLDGRGRGATRLVLAALAVTLVLAGCGGSDGNPGGTDASPGKNQAPTSSAQAHHGGQLTYQMGSEVRSMDPTVAGGSASSGEPPRLLAVYDGLMIVDNASGKLDMGLAESMTSEDNSVWTLKLRPNLKFTDGTPLDAEAVKFNWDRQGTVQTAPSVLLTKAIASVTVADPVTLKITLAAANGLFPRNVSASSLNYIASPTAVRAAGADFGSKPVGAGPFVMKSWVRDSEMILERNPDYWNAPKPYLDRVVLKVVSDETQRLNSLNAGEADATILGTPAAQQRAKDGGLSVEPINGLSVFGIAFNMQRPPFDDVRVRKAIIQAVDPVQLNEVAYQGLGDPATGFFPKGSPFYDKDLVYPPHDLKAAQALLDEYFKETGKEVDFPVEYVQTEQYASISDYLTGVFAKMDHIKYRGSFVQVGQLTTDIRSRNFSGIGYGYLGADPEPNMVETYLSKGARNFFGTNDPALDKALLAGRATSDITERRKAYVDAQKILVKVLPMVLFPRTTLAGVHSDKVGALPMYEDGGVRFDLAWVKS
jgi:peptide/nickel transport system substrate-binding protein